MLKRNILKPWFFATPPMRNARFCFPKGLPKRPKIHSKTTCYTRAFSTSKKHPPSFDFAPTWLPLGPPKAPPRGLQDLFKTTLGSILGHLGCKFNFFASLGVPPGKIFFNFDQILIKFQVVFALTIASTPFTNDSFCKNNCLCNYFGFSTSQRHNQVPWIALLSFFLQPLFCTVSLDLQVLNVTIGFHGLPLWGFVCISYLQNRPLPRRSGRSPREFRGARRDL